jgi:hypothetical protein
VGVPMVGRSSSLRNSSSSSSPKRFEPCETFWQKTSEVSNRLHLREVWRTQARFEEKGGFYQCLAESEALSECPNVMDVPYFTWPAGRKPNREVASPTFDNSTPVQWVTQRRVKIEESYHKILRVGRSRDK